MLISESRFSIVLNHSHKKPDQDEGTLNQGKDNKCDAAVLHGGPPQHCDTVKLWTWYGIMAESEHVTHMPGQIADVTAIQGLQHLLHHQFEMDLHWACIRQPVEDRAEARVSGCNGVWNTLVITTRFFECISPNSLPVVDVVVWMLSENCWRIGAKNKGE